MTSPHSIQPVFEDDNFIHSPTADIYIGPPPIVLIDLPSRDPIIPNLDIKIEREAKRRDWEQRQHKQRRR